MRVYQPSAELRPYIRYYWVLKSDEAFNILTFPIGCPQIIFHKATPIYIPELGISQYSLTISGQVNFSAHIQSNGGVEMIVAVFYPHTIGMFIDLPPLAFYNLEISGYDTGNSGLKEIARKIIECDNHNRCIEMLESWLQSKIVPSLNLSRINHSLWKMLYESIYNVSTLAASTCLGKKQFERIFREYVGMNPKEYSRIVRFQRAMRMMQCGERNFAGIAGECGYADQSHFIREFKKISGYTPQKFLLHCIPYSDLFTNPR